MNKYHENQLNLENRQIERNNSNVVFQSYWSTQNQEVNSVKVQERRNTNADKIFNRITNNNKISSKPISSSSNEAKLNEKFNTSPQDKFIHENVHRLWPFSSTEFYQFIRDAAVNHLKYLTAQNCSITNLDFITNFPELVLLDASNNNISTLNLTIVQELSNMKYLMLANNNLSDFDFSTVLNKWKEFRFIDLSYNNFSCQFVRNIKYEFLKAKKIVRFESNIAEC